MNKKYNFFYFFLILFFLLFNLILSSFNNNNNNNNNNDISYHNLLLSNIRNKKKIELFNKTFENYIQIKLNENKIINEKQNKQIFPNIFNLPKLENNSNVINILVGYSIANIKLRLKYLNRQLYAFLDACENGYNIHVIILTYQKEENLHDHVYPSLYNEGLYYCYRIKQVLPIVFDFTTGYLPSKHRFPFYYFQDQYDYFLAQEDDVTFSKRNLDYFVKWSKHLSGTVFTPAFSYYEIGYKETNKMNRQNELHPLTSRYGSLNFFNVRNVTFMSIDRSIQLGVMFTKQMLNDMITKTEEWFDDFSFPFYEPNVHFGRTFLGRHYMAVFPIDDFHRSTMHHLTNKYVGKINITKIPPNGWRYMSLIELLVVYDMVKKESFGSIQAKSSIINVTGEKFNNNNNKDKYIPLLSCIQQKGMMSVVDPFWVAQISWDKPYFECKVKYGKCVPYTEIKRMQLMKCNNESDGSLVSICNPEKYLSPINQTSNFD